MFFVHVCWFFRLLISSRKEPDLSPSSSEDSSQRHQHRLREFGSKRDCCSAAADESSFSSSAGGGGFLNRSFSHRRVIDSKLPRAPVFLLAGRHSQLHITFPEIALNLCVRILLALAKWENVSESSRFGPGWNWSDWQSDGETLAGEEQWATRRASG